MSNEANDGKTRQWARAKKIVQGMKPWCENVNGKKAKKGQSARDGRTVNEACFDSGVFAAAELIRRLTGDEELSLAVHEMCIWRQRQHEKNVAGATA